MRRSLAVVFTSLCLALGASTVPAAGEQKFVLDYRPPRLSLEARGIPLAEVLTRVGSAVGFEVVGRGASLVDIVIRDASLDDVLRRLLQGENHTLLYRRGDGAGSPPALDRVVLLGASQTLARESEPRGGPQVGSAVPEARGASASPGSSAPSAPAPAVAAPPDATPLLSWGRDAGGEDEQREVTLSDVLQAHALAALQAGQVGPAGPPAGTRPAPASRDVQADLAETTRRAQQGLSALVDGLAAATRSLQESMAAGRK